MNKLLKISFLYVHLAIFIGHGSIVCYSSEIDSFTGRYEEFEAVEQEDPTPTNILDHLVERKLFQAIQEANESKLGCNVAKLHTSIKKYLSGPRFLDVEAVYGVLEGIVDQGKHDDLISPIRRRHTNKKESVYKNFHIFEAPMISAHISTTFPVDHPVYGKMLIGSDKLGHFFGQGFSYFERSKTQGYEKTFEWGDRSEKGHMGWTTTGIYSYGDLSANYEGMTFWERLLDKTHKGDPYITCEDGRWKRTEHTPFQWNDYLNPGMDEGINCNVYRDEHLKNKVLQAQKKLNDQDPSHRYFCPTELKQCSAIIKHYKKEEKKRKNFARKQPVKQREQLPSLVGHVLSPECKEAHLKKELPNPSKEQLQSKCLPSSLYGQCKRLLCHGNNLAHYFSRGMYDYYWDNTSRKMTEHYQSLFPESSPEQQSQEQQSGHCCVVDPEHDYMGLIPQSFDYSDPD